MTMPKTIELHALNQFRRELAGELIFPSDIQYDAARQGFNLTMDQYPEMIVIAQSSEDVALTIQFANEFGYSVGMMSTGHGVVLPADNAILVIMSQLNQIEIDPDEQTAVLGAGLRWGAVLEATQQFGLAPLLGSSPTVGIVGYTLGGGMGWLARKYGLATDSVIYFEVVTSDGQQVRASATENSDLFWALRGGGGNFGVVTAMKIKLYPVSTVYAGNLFYAIEDAKEVFEFYRQWIIGMPDEMTSSVVVMNFPPIPEMPDILRGKTYVMVRGCYCGDVSDGEAIVQYWRAWKKPIIDDFKVMAFSAAASISSDPVDPLPGLSTGAWLHEINDDVIQAICNNVPGHTSVVFAEIRHAGGAIARVDESTAAYGNRDAQHILQMIGITPTPEAQENYHAYTDMIKQAMASALTGGVYLNFVDGKAAREKTQAAYSEANFRRLQSLKSKVDPKNNFRYSFDLEIK